MIADLYPTQFAVGFREVAHKRWRYRQASPAERAALISGRAVPVVRGPGGRTFVLDRHHWLCALQAEGVASAPTFTVGDLSASGPDRFWRTLQDRGWCRLYDAEGRRRSHEDMPQSLSALQDDPFRSLASALRRRGGFDKIDVPFSEFHWADGLRRSLDPELLAQDFEAALERGLLLASCWASSAPEANLRDRWLEKGRAGAIDQTGRDQGEAEDDQVGGDEQGQDHHPRVRAGAEEKHAQAEGEDRADDQPVPGQATVKAPQLNLGRSHSRQGKRPDPDDPRQRQAAGPMMIEHGQASQTGDSDPKRAPDELCLARRGQGQRANGARGQEDAGEGDGGKRRRQERRHKGQAA
ncbi:ParB-like protein [Phenylobacterium soli]|uniref:ParB-like protein n=1 Tax=Phenylobacterium soli TaxID=2170551 RepID=UPI0014024F8D|nr:ParB-like protein [Phenylobacterium soli]